MSSIFLCHSHKDKSFARRLSERLQSHGIRTWIDEAEMHIGDSLIAKIETAIQEFTYLGVILSPNSISSEWVRREVNIALTEEIQGKRVKVLPILYKECEVPGFLAAKVYADFSQDFEEGLKKILERLTSDLHDETYKQKRIFEIFQTAYRDWISFGEKDHQLLPRDTIMLILQNLLQFNLSLDLIEYLFCSVSYLYEREKFELDRLRLLSHEIGTTGVTDLFDRLLRHPNPRVRVGAAKLLQQVAEMKSIDGLVDTLIASIKSENFTDARRAYIQSIWRLRGQLPKGFAQLLLDSDKDWMIQTYALLSLDKSRVCLLISDGTDFASELGTIAQEAGFTMVTLSTPFPFLEIDDVEDDIFKAFELILLVRGEHYNQTMHGRFYWRLRHFVDEGGNLFATSWVSWETKHYDQFLNVLPFIHVRDSYNEDVVVTCQPTGSELAQKIFPAHITLCTSFEMLQARESSITLLETDTGIPIFGYNQFGSGLCYYLNTCQHSCISSMQSPLQTSPELYGCLHNVFEWIYQTERVS